jgi:arylsulfatase A-like enzyme
MNHPVFDRRGVHSWQLAHITDWFPTLLTAAQQVEQLAAADRTSQTDSLLSS